MANSSQNQNQDAPHQQHERSNDRKDDRSACFLYEVTPGRRHLHGNSHATGATNIEPNQYQGPPEIDDKIILHHPTQRLEQGFDSRSTQADLYQQRLYQRRDSFSPSKESTSVYGESSRGLSFTSKQPNIEPRRSRFAQATNLHEKHHLQQRRPEQLLQCQISPQKMVSPQKQPSNQSASSQIFFKHSTDVEYLTPNYGIHSPMAKRSPTKERYNMTTSNPTNISGMNTSNVIPPMSPLTVDTENVPQTSKSTPFYYSQSHGPLRSPGIFVPFEDERKREIIENAIREALNREEQMLQNSTQPFPLQDPPKHKIKRAISTDSNESVSNRIQSYPSKRFQDVDEVDHDNQGSIHSFDDNVEVAPTKSINDTSCFSTKETRVVNSITDIDKQERMAVTCSQLNKRNMQNRETLFIPTSAQSQLYKDSDETADVPMTPYTTNVKWVISNPNPTSLNDFKEARTNIDDVKSIPNNRLNRIISDDTYDPETPTDESLIRKVPYEFKHMNYMPDKTLAAEQSQSMNVGLDKSIPPYHHAKICGDYITSDLNPYQYDRDAKPLSSVSGVSVMTKVTEQGFNFPKKSLVTEPILFSPRIVGERFRPNFESTPKSIPSPMCSPAKTCTYTSPIKRTISSPTIASSSLQQSRHPHTALSSPAMPSCSWQHPPNINQAVDYGSSNQDYSQALETDSIHNDLIMRPTLSTERESISRSASLSHSNDSISRQKANGYIRNSFDNVLRKSGNVGRDPDDGHLSDLFFKREMERFFRSHSAVEISPSKKDIEKVRERVRQVYRSISNPVELKEHLKNMLVEEHMKEEFLSDNNEVFESSPIKNDSMWENFYQHPMHRNYYHQQNTREHQYRNEEARRRLFVDKDTLPSFSPLNAKRQLQKEAHRQLDLPRLLSDIFSNSCDETQEYPNANIYEEDNVRRPAIERQRTGQPCSGHRYEQELQDDRYDCNMPGCSHSNVRHPRDTNRKRKRGDIELCVNCEDDDVCEKSRVLQNALQKVQHPVGKNCSCAKIESAILEMARDAYQKIRRLDSSEHSFDRFNNEATETREQIFDSVKVLCGIKSMCKYGRIIEDIFSGSIVFLLNCPTIFALEDLWNRYIIGELTEMFNDSFLTDRLKSKFSLPKARLTVFISQEAYNQAKHELDTVDVHAAPIQDNIGTTSHQHIKDVSGMTKLKCNTSLSKSDTEIASVCSSSKENHMADTTRRKKVKPSALAIIHMRSQSAPSGTQSPSPSPSWMSQLSNSPFSKEKTFSFSIAGDQSPRKAFQEISTGSPTLNINSPTSKKVFDFDLTLTPKSSPKRKTLGERTPFDNENINQVTSSSKRKSIRD